MVALWYTRLFACSFPFRSINCTLQQTTSYLEIKLILIDKTYISAQILTLYSVKNGKNTADNYRPNIDHSIFTDKRRLWNKRWDIPIVTTIRSEIFRRKQETDLPVQVRAFLAAADPFQTHNWQDIWQIIQVTKPAVCLYTNRISRRLRVMSRFVL